MAKNTGRLVYSTETGRLCGECNKPLANCICKQLAKQQLNPGDGIVRLGFEVKGRNGKGVTLVRGVPLAEAELKKLAKELKQFCGTGGALKQGVIEIQGEQRQKLKPLLQQKGWQVKIAGG